MTETLLELIKVSKSFSFGKKRRNMALNQIDLTIQKGEILGIVGESGCGKSTLARVIMGVYQPSAGQVQYEGKPLKLASHSQRKKFAMQAQMIFQDPYQSLDPHMTVESIIGENLEIHGRLTKTDRQKRIYERMEMTGLPREYASRYPHEFSGGQRQRIGIARALAMDPKFLICDEPISALDLSVRSQIMNLLMDLKESMDLTYLFISHDLNMVHHISDRIAVMYAGRIVELGSAQEVYEHPRHPYTQMLLEAVLTPEPNKDWLNQIAGIEGELTTIATSEMGCSFADRCPRVSEQCRTILPDLTEVSTGHFTACYEVSSIKRLKNS